MSPPISPDGYFYLAAARGEAVPHPYRLRWLLPLVLGANSRAWQAVTYASLGVTPFVAFAYFWTLGLRGMQAAGATLLLSVLPGVWRCSLRFPVLLDAPSFALALGTAVAARDGSWWLAVLLGLVSGAVRETAPLFAAVWAWSPWPLLGLLVTGWWRPRASSDISWLTRPYSEAWELRNRVGLDWTLYLRPWGAALAGLAAVPSWQMVTTLVLAHAQLFAAQDTIRLTAWAAPVLVAAAVRVIPVEWIFFAVVSTLFSTAREDRV